MTLATPKLVVLDSATLGRASRDYSAADKTSRDRAKSFLAQLNGLGVFVAFTLTHVFELLRHANKEVVWDRLGFLRTIPLIAWLRPYDRHWFPGSAVDLLCRELHVVVHGGTRSWRHIVNEVRPDLWETGAGSDMFVDNAQFWSAVTRAATSQHELEVHVASLARTDAGSIMDRTLGDLLRLPIRPREERAAYMRRFAQELTRELSAHGDARLASPGQTADDFADDILRRIMRAEEPGGDTMQRLMDMWHVPVECLSLEMTVGDLGDLRVYGRQLKVLAAALRPPIDVSIRDVPLDTLPSLALKRELSSIQRKAPRVSGSDVGDRHVAPLVFYAEGIEVDKRTHEFLVQVGRKNPRLKSLMARFFRSSDYSKIPQLFDE